MKIAIGELQALSRCIIIIFLALCGYLAAPASVTAEDFDNRSFVKLPFLSYQQKHTKAAHFYVAPGFNCQNRKGLKKYYVEFGDYKPTAKDFLHASRLVLMKLRETQFPIGCRLEVKEYDFINFKSHAVHKNKIIAAVEFSTYRPFLAPNKERLSSLTRLVQNQIGEKPTPGQESKNPFFWSVSLRKIGGYKSFIGVGDTQDQANNDAIKKCKAEYRPQTFATKCIIVAKFAGDEPGCVATVNGSTRSGAADLVMFYSVNKKSNACTSSRAVSSCYSAGTGKTGWDCRNRQTFTRNDALKAIWTNR